MEELNFGLRLYVVDDRPPEQMRVLIEQIFGFQLQLTENDNLIGESAFSTQVFGFSFGLRLAVKWDEGYVYCLNAGTLNSIYEVEGKVVSLDSHIARLLRQYHIDTIMTPKEFGAMDKQKFLEKYAELRRRVELE